MSIVLLALPGNMPVGSGDACTETLALRTVGTSAARDTVYFTVYVERDSRVVPNAWATFGVALANMPREVLAASPNGINLDGDVYGVSAGRISPLKYECGKVIGKDTMMESQ